MRTNLGCRPSRSVSDNQFLISVSVHASVASHHIASHRCSRRLLPWKSPGPVRLDRRSPLVYLRPSRLHLALSAHTPSSSSRRKLVTRCWSSSYVVLVSLLRASALAVPGHYFRRSTTRYTRHNKSASRQWLFFSLLSLCISFLLQVFHHRRRDIHSTYLPDGSFTRKLPAPTQPSPAFCTRAAAGPPSLWLGVLHCTAPHPIPPGQSSALPASLTSSMPTSLAPHPSPCYLIQSLAALT